MLQSPPTHALFDSGTVESVPLHEPLLEQARRELAQRLSFTVAYELWVDSWEMALAALASASQSRTLSTDEAAAHRAVVAAERELVTKTFTLLIGADVLEKWSTTNSEVHGR